MPGPRILLIEDDLDIARVVAFDLEEAGFQVIHAASGMAGLIQAREVPPDLVLLDLGLPDFDGSLVVERLRSNTALPIIALTARDAPEEKVRLLNLGANDYLVKPFQVRELIARIGVQLRSQQEPLLVLGALVMRLSHRVARYAGEDLRLSPKEFELLTLLMQEPGRVYSRDMIVQHLWPDSPQRSSNLVDVHIANLRDKLRDQGGYGVLRTVRGFGYALRA